MSAVSIKLLQELCQCGRFRWTNHSIARAQERNIDPSDIRNAIMTGEIIEQYPNDYPYPSCLVLGMTVLSHAVHIVVGIADIETTDAQLWFITAYYPDVDKWSDDFKARKAVTS